MFRRVRLELVAWYAGSFTLILVAIGLSAYFFLRSSLDHEINDSIEHTYEDVVEHPRPARGGAPGATPGDPIRDAAFAAVPTDVFVVVTDAEGDLLTNPRQVSLEDVNFAKLSRGATNSKGTWTDVGGGGGAYRIASYPYANGDVIHIGRSLEARNTQLDRLSLVMLIGGIAGLVLATGGGLWLAGRSLIPIRRSFETQRRFVSDASHELRTPIAVVRANNELLQRHPEETIGENMDQVDAIADESEHLTRLIEDLLMLARADEGRLALNPTEFDLGELAAEVARDLGPVAAAKGVSLESDVAHVAVGADRQRIRQVLVILLDNAVKYTPAGGQVRVIARRAGHRAEVTVRDTGPGIAAEQLPKIFDRFYQADTARTPSAGGTGLGLAIAKLIAEMHRGGLSATSVPGKGSAFTLRLRA